MENLLNLFPYFLIGTTTLIGTYLTGRMHGEDKQRSESHQLRAQIARQSQIIDALSSAVPGDTRPAGYVLFPNGPQTPNRR